MKSALFFAALLVAAPAPAQTAIDETRPLAAGGRVSIENLKGKVVVRSWDKAQVHVAGSLGQGVEKLEIAGGDASLSIRVRNPERDGGWFGRDDEFGPTLLEVTVPRGASLSVEAVSADVEATGTGGALLELESVSGDVTVRGATARQVRVESVSGDVDVEADSRDVGASTVSGDVRVGGRVGGRIEISGVSGDVTLASGPVDRLSVETVSGGATIDTALAAGGRIGAESVSGDVRLTLPAATSARLRVESFSGTIRSPVGTVETEEFGPGSHLDARLGAGDGDISLESFSGNVRIETK